VKGRREKVLCARARVGAKIDSRATQSVSPAESRRACTRAKGTLREQKRARIEFKIRKHTRACKSNLIEHLEWHWSDDFAFGLGI
jgi:hypothetical protein